MIKRADGTATLRHDCCRFSPCRCFAFAFFSAIIGSGDYTLTIDARHTGDGDATLIAVIAVDTLLRAAAKRLRVLPRFCRATIFHVDFHII